MMWDFVVWLFLVITCNKARSEFAEVMINMLMKWCSPSNEHPSTTRQLLQRLENSFRLVPFFSTDPYVFLPIPMESDFLHPRHFLSLNMSSSSWDQGLKRQKGQNTPYRTLPAFHTCHWIVASQRSIIFWQSQPDGIFSKKVDHSEPRVL